MYRFRIELAGTVAEVDALYESSRNLCKDYLTSKPAELYISVTKDDLEKEHRLSSTVDLSEQNLEYLALYRKLSTALACNDTVLVHGSCISVDGQAYLFCAPSGTGKSTHTGLWRQYLGDRAVMINDDKPLLRVINDSVMIYGTPWNGKHHLGYNLSAPLKAICFLDRGKKNAIERTAKDDIFPLLIRYVFRPELPADMNNVLGTASRIADKCDFWSLKCDISQEAAKVSYTAMSAES